MANKNQEDFFNGNCLNNKEAQLIWDEYKYRHEHIWQTLFRITGSSVVLGIVPYLNNQFLNNLGLWMIGPPLLAVILVWFASERMKSELAALDRVREIHKNRQAVLFGPSAPSADKSDSTFNSHAKHYLCSLLFIGVVNVLLILWAKLLCNILVNYFDFIKCYEGI